MIRKILAAGLVALAALSTAVPAGAAGLSVEFGTRGAPFGADERHHGRGYGYGWDHHRNGGRHQTLSPREVRQILRHRGYRNIDYVDRRGTIYQVRATDYRGKRVGLIVSARSGSILTAYVLG